MRTFIAALIVLVFGGASLANGGSIVSFGFEDKPVGSFPSGWISGSYDGFPVDAYVTDTTAGEGTRSFYLNDYKSVSQISAKTQFASRSSGQFRLTGMARAEQNDTVLNPFGLIDSYNRRYTTLVFGENGEFIYMDGRGNRVVSGVSYQPSEWYSFEYVIDMDAMNWSFSVEDSLETPVLARSDLGFDTNTGYSFNQIRSWGTWGSDFGEWYIDNVQLNQIPEPSTLILLLLGTAGLFACSRRRRR